MEPIQCRREPSTKLLQLQHRALCFPIDFSQSRDMARPAVLASHHVMCLSVFQNHPLSHLTSLFLPKIHRILSQCHTTRTAHLKLLHPSQHRNSTPTVWLLTTSSKKLQWEIKHDASSFLTWHRAEWLSVHEAGGWSALPDIRLLLRVS